MKKKIIDDNIPEAHGNIVREVYLLPAPKPKTLSFETMNENGWNAVALPIPDDASPALLREIHGWATSFHDIYNDDAKEYYCSGLKIPEEITKNADLACARWHEAFQRLKATGAELDYGEQLLDEALTEDAKRPAKPVSKLSRWAKRTFHL